LITGGSGFIGFNFVNAILKYEDQSNIFLLQRRTSRKKSVFDGILNNIKIVDFNKIDVIKKTIKNINPNIIIHLAYSKEIDISENESHEEYLSNLKISHNIIEAARELSFLDKFIFLGSCDEYGIQSEPFQENMSEKPLTSYGASKLSITKTLMNLNFKEGFPAVVVRPSIVYGPGQSDKMFLPLLASRIKSNLSINMTLGEQFRDFIYISDVINILLRLSLNQRLGVGEIFNISYGKSYSIKNVATKFANILKPNGEDLLNIGAIKYRNKEVMNYFVSNEKAKNLLNWYPQVNLDTGLRNMNKSYD
jgi:UDP-glucose 4-epimerase